MIISKRAKSVSESEAMDYVGGYTIALDMTARDWQDHAKKNALPWSKAKGFDTSCPIGPFVPKAEIPDVNNLRVWCKVNGDTRQNGHTGDMIYKLPFLISYISNLFTLEPGDLLLTGTPEGVGPVKAGDTIEAGINDIVTIKFNIQDNNK